MKLTANITLDELTKSQTAERKGINNNPNPKIGIINILVFHC